MPTTQRPATIRRDPVRTTFLTRNLLHLARMIKDAGGIPAHGNQKSLWDAGCRLDYANPEHRA